MDPLDEAQARDHIEMVARILAESSQKLCAGNEFFIVWGIFSGAFTVTWQLIDNRTVPAIALVVPALMLVAAIVFSIVRGRQLALERGRRSLLHREFLNVLWLTLGLAFVVNYTAFNLFSGWGEAAIWSFAETIVLFYIGIHGNRRAQIAGIVVLASIVSANFSSHNVTGYILAAGMVAGYAGFGIAESLSHD